MDINFQEAWVNRPHTVLGVRLKPFSLEHLFALLIIDSPFAAKDREIEWGDLELAVAICGRTRPLSDLYRIAKFSPVGRLRRHFLRRQLEKHAGAFVAYISDYHALPPSAEGDGKKAKAPWILRMVETFIARGMSDEAAWTMESGKAFYRFATIAELETGESNLLDEEEQALLGLIPDDTK